MHIASVLFSTTLFYFTLQSSPIAHIQLAPFFSQKSINSTKKGASPNKIIVKTESIPHKSYKNAEKNYIFCIFYIHTDKF